MKKLVVMIIVAIMAMTILAGCGNIQHKTTVQSFGVGDSYQLKDGTWIVFGKNGPIEFGR